MSNDKMIRYVCPECGAGGASPATSSVPLCHKCDYDVVMQAALAQKSELAQVSQSISARYSPRDWDEDFSHENGYYSCRCGTCSMMFHGHKRRVTCKECASNSKPAKVNEHHKIMQDVIDKGTGIGIVKDGRLQHVKRDDFYLSAEEIQAKVSQPVDSIRNYPEFVTDILRLSDASVSKDTKQQIRKSIYDTIDSRVANAAPKKYQELRREYEELKHLNYVLQSELLDSDTSLKSVEKSLDGLGYFGTYAEQIESLKLRVAELEAESRTKHEYAMQMLVERAR